MQTAANCVEENDNIQATQDKAGTVHEPGAKKAVPEVEQGPVRSQGAMATQATVPSADVSFVEKCH